MANVNLGKILITPKGIYNQTVKYAYLDIVRYGGATYICNNRKGAPAGYGVEDTAYWQKLAQDGDISYATLTEHPPVYDLPLNNASLDGTANNNRCYKDRIGRVTVNFRLIPASQAPALVLATLPFGFRPIAHVYAVAVEVGQIPHVIACATAGTVYLPWGGASSLIAGQISFQAAI